MAQEKNFETRIKNYLKSIGVYPLGTPTNKMVEPIGYYEKRWGGGKFTKSGLPDMHIVIDGLNIDAELKGPDGVPSKLQIRNLEQINNSKSYALLLYPDDFEEFKNMCDAIVEDLPETAFQHFNNIMSKYYE